MITADLIATCSVVVAVAAVGATFFQQRATHKHNKLSVRPLLTWHSSRRAENEGTYVTYSLRNHGLGPAVVKDRYFSKDTMRFQPPNLAIDEVTAFIDTVLGNKVRYQLRTYGLPGVEAAIPSQGEIVIGQLFFPGLPAEQLGLVEQLAGEVHFHVHYESMYREPYYLNSAGTHIDAA